MEEKSLFSELSSLKVEKEEKVHHQEDKSHTYGWERDTKFQGRISGISSSEIVDINFYRSKSEVLKIGSGVSTDRIEGFNFWGIYYKY